MATVWDYDGDVGAGVYVRKEGRFEKQSRGFVRRHVSRNSSENEKTMQVEVFI